MAKRITKAELILGEARQRTEAARNKVHEAESVLDMAQAAFAAHKEALDALEKALTPTTRKAAAKKKQDSPASPTPTLLPDNETKEPMCVVCGHGPDYQDHFEPSPAYHPFASSARTASKRSSRKGSGTKSEVSTANEGDGAIAAGASGD